MSPYRSALVVDPSVNVGQSLAFILELSFFSVTRATNACQALEMLHHCRFDLVCLEIIQQDMEMVTLLSRIEELQPQIPGVVITSYPSIRRLIEIHCPANWSYFLKPVDPDLLLDRVNKLFELGSE